MGLDDVFGAIGGIAGGIFFDDPEGGYEIGRTVGTVVQGIGDFIGSFTNKDSNVGQMSGVQLAVDHALAAAQQNAQNMVIGQGKILLANTQQSIQTTASALGGFINTSVGNLINTGSNIYNNLGIQPTYQTVMKQNPYELQEEMDEET